MSRWETFCEFPEDLIGVLTKPEFRMTVPIPFKPEVVEWASENLRGAYELTCIGTQIHEDEYGVVFDYYLHFENEVDMLMFKLKWFDAQISE